VTSNGYQGADQARWHASLPADLQRAASEIYRSLRAAGSASVRDWMQSVFPQGQGDSPQCIDLWTPASAIDFKLAQEPDDASLMRSLVSDDFLELSLRRLAAYVCQKRSGNKTGALHMLAVKPPGSGSDIAPEWLVSSATLHSKSEYQREERVRHETKTQRGDGGPGGAKGGAGPRGAIRAQEVARERKEKRKEGRHLPPRANFYKRIVWGNPPCRRPDGGANAAQVFPASMILQLRFLLRDSSCLCLFQ
jgi:hypothetical protein